MTIKSFRGLIKDLAIDTIPLSTNNGSTGYKIKKFELFPSEPGVNIGEHVVKIYSISQATATGTIDFADNTILASAYLAMNNQPVYGTDMITVFENMTFNQDIYITHKDNATGIDVNYYIELEQVTLDLNENTVATLKDIRNIASQ
jgi:hypothetical protein